MKLLRPSADQAVYHDFIMAPTTSAAGKRLYYAFVVEGELDLGRLDRAIGHAVARHEALRTSVRVVDGELTQVVREVSEITERPWTTADWDGTPESTTRIIHDMDGWWTVPRELAIRCVVGRSPQGRTLVACLFDHVCVDGISTEIVADLIGAEYDAPSGQTRTEQFSGYYPPMLEEGMREVYGDWLRLIDCSNPAVPPGMLEKKLAAEKAWTRFHGWDLPAAVRDRVQQLTRAYRCTPFEALAVCAGIYFRRADGQPAGLGVAVSGRHRPHGFDVVGLLRGYALDVADFRRCGEVREAFAARRDTFRYHTSHVGRLPAAEVCRRARVPTGWRAGALGPWQVELSGMYEKPARAMGGFAAGIAPTVISEDDYCENSGPMFLLSFTMGPGRIEAVMRYTDPPVTTDLAKQVAADIESTVEFVAAEPGGPLVAAPAFFRIAQGGT